MMRLTSCGARRIRSSQHGQTRPASDPPNRNFKSRTLYRDDNLDFLRGMNSGTVNLIATDPPFNKGRDFHATPDSLAAGAKFQDRWKWDDVVDGAWVDQITDDWPHVMNVINGARLSYGDDMGAFLCFLGVRLIEMRRILADDGSIYLHCDPTASHYLKQLMDAIFGKQNFQTEIVWSYGFGGSSQRRFSRKHDLLLFYTKTQDYVFNKPQVPATSQMMRGEMKGTTDIWDIPTINNMAKERTGYPTQKPLALYERIISASSNSGDLVLDPFAGCATTPIAAERLGRQWVAMDIWQGAYGVVKQRLEANRQLLADSNPQIHYETAAPSRTDDAEEAVPFLQVKERYKEPQGPRMTRQEMFDHLIAQYGQRCQGCNRRFDDPLYLELDHNTPRSQGGLNHITNRVLLCGPCNRIKSDRYTLRGLQQENRKRSRMAK